ncbi:50S ribosomal protein L23 [Amygdalobacter nucleatus]|uniref:Large ribosomal subunit protein uL23 n=1 Tax=Amygdalobacter nucleatus TaxID=3029274 RepID=A0A133Y6W8_9FIRM|nr:50S ribosomal protein L23 [Amygdalobacter nucleatus]KXB38941.1 ribosomal protein L23 [Amygdalobacter nucleatus]MDF0485293.1 50S ribosomal protein L23 [Amygdalobacter nucleatus]WEG36839.1 50S ribosomal protein L23 [Amygdalobacter nucleatus]
MKTAHDVILKPIITEHSSSEMAVGRYTFQVAVDANKVEIKDAVEKLFNVRVLDVCTMNKPGKAKRVGVHQGVSAQWKKAIVKIDLEPKAAAYLTKGGQSVAVDKKYKTTIEEFGFNQQ